MCQFRKVAILPIAYTRFTHIRCKKWPKTKAKPHVSNIFLGLLSAKLFWCLAEFEKMADKMPGNPTFDLENSAYHHVCWTIYQCVL